MVISPIEPSVQQAYLANDLPNFTTESFDIGGLAEVAQPNNRDKRQLKESN